MGGERASGKRRLLLCLCCRRHRAPEARKFIYFANKWPPPLLLALFSPSPRCRFALRAAAAAKAAKAPPTCRSLATAALEPAQVSLAEDASSRAVDAAAAANSAAWRLVYSLALSAPKVSL